jgi:hypothetical protein
MGKLSPKRRQHQCGDKSAEKAILEVDVRKRRKRYSTRFRDAEKSRVEDVVAELLNRPNEALF